MLFNLYMLSMRTFQKFKGKVSVLGKGMFVVQFIVTAVRPYYFFL